MTTATIKGDKFPRTIDTMETGEATRDHLLASGYDGQIYLASRPFRDGRDAEMVAMVYRIAKTGEFVFAL